MIRLINSRPVIVLIIGLVVLFCQPVWAQDSIAVGSGSQIQSPQTQNGPPDMGGYFLRVLWVTVLIIGLIYLAYRWYKKTMFPGRVAGKARIGVLARHYIGPKQMIVVVVVEGRKLVLGTTENSVNLISDLGPYEMPAEDQAHDSSFPAVLKRLRKDKS